ncbi:MAG: NUDIX domain-containing protein, partial [Myxococcales bacterium]|nr:NUDIX domain-containing protein [Myxococcales bacterium]
MRATTSLLLLRRPADPEVYWVRRHDDDRFLSGFMVFPGGAVDAGDGEGDAALRRAAVRETFEETGYLHADGAPPTAEERAAVRAGEVDFTAWCAATGRAPRLDALVPA